MYEIEFYKDKNGISEITEYIKELNRKSSTNKESQIKFNKIVANSKNTKKEIEQAKRNL